MNYISVSSIPANPPPKVSVVMVTYNHESFIAQAIDGVLIQQTTFPIELVIGEDCSSDNTRDIVVEFQRRHPDKVRLLLWNKNAGAAVNFKETLGACHGQYIAFCEGDDYWTDPHKLQRQVDLLDDREDLALCHHLVDYAKWEDGLKKVLFSHPPESYRGTRSARDLVECNFVQTCSLLVRRSCLPVLDSRYLLLRVGDWPLTFLVAEHGDIGYLETSMADYRIHDDNGWYQQPSDLHRFESARVCMYLASVAKPGARDLWRTKGISMLRLLMEEQPGFRDAARLAWVAWRTKSVSFPQAFRLLERDFDKWLYPLESRLAIIDLKVQEVLHILSRPFMRKYNVLLRSIGKRHQRLSRSLDKRFDRISRSFSKRFDRLSRSLQKRRRKIADKLLLEQRKDLAINSMDRSKETILVVSHEASRTGAPTLALNIAQQLGGRYNVVALLLGPGGLVDDFNKDCCAVVCLFPDSNGSNYGWALLEKLFPILNFKFAIVNSIVSIHILPHLKLRRVPTLCLVHEFASYTPPKTAICEVEQLAGKVVFSADVVYENNAEQCQALSEEYGSVILPQGKCVIPSSACAEPDPVEAGEIRKALRPESCPEDTVVILGAGSVGIRKGVDLFLMCAARVVELQPKRPFRFVWVGGGFNPEKDFGYSVYIQDQIIRAELAKDVFFMDEVSNIELVYELSDFLFLSSRLDPLPNVAIDSMLKKLPVLCFDRTTGIADILKQGGLGETCVIPYLDIEQAARRIASLIDDIDLRKRLGEAVGELAARRFDMKQYVDELERHALGCVSELQIEESKVMDLAFFSPPGTPTLSYQRAARRFVRSWTARGATRKPFPGFNPAIYQDVRGLSGTDENPLAAFLNAGRPEGIWLSSPITPEDGRQRGGGALRTALHVDVSSILDFSDIYQRLLGQDATVDLLVSVSSEQLVDDVSLATMEYRMGTVSIRRVSGRGGLQSLQSGFASTVLENYDVIGHVHGAQNKASEAVKFALENLIGGLHPMASTILGEIAARDQLGLVFPDDPNVFNWVRNRSEVDKAARFMGIPELPERHFDFPVGAMFWAKTVAIKPILTNLSHWDDDVGESLNSKGGVDLILAQLMPFIAKATGYDFATTYVPGVTR